MKVLKVVLSLVAVLMLAVAVSNAQEPKAKNSDQKGQKGRFQRMGNPIDRILAMDSLKLTDDQKKQLTALKDKYAEKLKDTMAGGQGLLTDEQKKAAKEAMDKAKADGKTGRDLYEAAKNAVTLTDEQKEKATKAREQAGKTMQEIQDELKKILTPEQQEQLQKMRPGGGKRGQKKAPEAT